MNIVLVSDIHFGVKQNDVTFLNNSRDYFLNDISKIIEEQKCKYLIIGGDLFDNRIVVDVLVKNTTMQVFQTLLDKFEDLKIVLLCGNHDIYYKTTLEVTSLKIFKNFHERLQIVLKMQKFDFDGCKAVLVPWLIEGSPNEKIFKNIIAKYKETGKKQFDLCIGHFSVNGFEVVRGVKEEHGLSLEDFKAFDTVFSGHFHIRNKMGNVQYLGCPYEITWNDWGDKKGATVFNTDTREATFYENKSSPKHILVKMSSLDKNLIEEAELKGNYVKVIIDEVLEPSRKLELSKKLEELTNDVIEIDETTPTLDGEEIEVTEESIASPLEALTNYTTDKSVKIPEGLDTTKLTLFLKDLYDRSVKEAKE